MNYDINNIVKQVITEIHLNDYSDEDFIEVFINKFRPWVKKKHGDDIGGYPMSLIIKTYFEEFCKEFDLNTRSYGGPSAKMSSAGRDIVEKGLHKLPSLGKKEQFTEKYKKGIEILVRNLDLPDFITIKFEEERPYLVYGSIDVDFDKFINSDISLETYRTVNQIGSILRNNFEHFLGASYGNPSHGFLDFRFSSSPNMIGEESWIKTVLNKVIKKEIKKIPGGSQIHSIKYERNSFTIRLKLVFKSSCGWSTQREVTDKARTLVRELGYSPEILKVDN
jgi:hypothetical protein